MNLTDDEKQLILQALKHQQAHLFERMQRDDINGPRFLATEDRLKRTEALYNKLDQEA